MTIVTHNLDELVKVDKAIAQASGKSFEDVLAKEAREVSWETYRQLRALPPGSGFERARQLASAAKVRGYEMGRRGNSLTPAEQGISQRAWRGARQMLGGEKSSFFKVQDSDGIPLIRRARWSARKSGKLLRGGRKGNKFAPSAKRASELEAEKLKAELDAHPELKRLNLRALATANEIRLRGMAAKGGTLAIQFLPRFYRNTKSATVKNGPLVEHSARTKLPLGRLDFVHSGDNLTGLIWSAFVPGTAEVMQRHNIMAAVEAARVADRLQYLERKMNERLQKAVTGIPAKKL